MFKEVYVGVCTQRTSKKKDQMNGEPTAMGIEEKGGWPKRHCEV
jgi:hypothetical protein